MEYRKVDYVVGVGFDAQPIIVTHNIELDTDADADADVDTDEAAGESAGDEKGDCK